MPRHVLFLARHAAIGMGLAVLFVALMVGVDLGRLGTLVRTSSCGGLALAALTFVLGLTFASAQMGIAIMSLGDRPGAGGGRMPRQRAAPAPAALGVPARARSASLSA